MTKSYWWFLTPYIINWWLVDSFYPHGNLMRMLIAKCIEVIHFALIMHLALETCDSPVLCAWLPMQSNGPRTQCLILQQGYPAKSTPAAPCSGTLGVVKQLYSRLQISWRMHRLGSYLAPGLCPASNHSQQSVLGAYLATWKVSTWELT